MHADECVKGADVDEGADEGEGDEQCQRYHSVPHVHAPPLHATAFPAKCSRLEPVLSVVSPSIRMQWEFLINMGKRERVNEMTHSSYLLIFQNVLSLNVSNFRIYIGGGCKL